MKVYQVYADNCDYEEFDAVVVVAENESRALEMIQTGLFGHCYFKERQGEIHIEEIDLTKEHIVLECFR